MPSLSLICHIEKKSRSVVTLFPLLFRFLIVTKYELTGFDYI
jgi:hypothetical protein